MGGEKARIWEFKFIQKVGAVHSDSWLNMCNRGKEFCSTSPETRQKMSEAGKGKKKPLRSPEHCQKMSEAKKGKKKPPRSPEHCQKISDRQKGKAWWNDGITNFYILPEETPDPSWIKGMKPRKLKN